MNYRTVNMAGTSRRPAWSRCPYPAKRCGCYVVVCQRATFASPSRRPGRLDNSRSVHRQQGPLTKTQIKLARGNPEMRAADPGCDSETAQTFGNPPHRPDRPTPHGIAARSGRRWSGMTSRRGDRPRRPTARRHQAPHDLDHHRLLGHGPPKPQPPAGRTVCRWPPAARRLRVTIPIAVPAPGVWFPTPNSGASLSSWLTLSPATDASAGFAARASGQTWLRPGTRSPTRHPNRL